MMRDSPEKTPFDGEKDTIVIRPPIGTKSRWVRQSQSEGKKLTDWIIERVELVCNKNQGNKTSL
jgi:hypothetical protein